MAPSNLSIIPRSLMSESHCHRSLTLGHIQRDQVTPKEQLLSLAGTPTGPVLAQKENSSVRRSSCSQKTQLDGACPVSPCLCCISWHAGLLLHFFLCFMLSQPLFASFPISANIPYLCIEAPSSLPICTFGFTSLLNSLPFW